MIGKRCMYMIKLFTDSCDFLEEKLGIVVGLGHMILLKKRARQGKLAENYSENNL